LFRNFRKPHGHFESYGVPTQLESDVASPIVIDEFELQRAIEDYYSGRTALLSAALNQDAAEGVVTAMWSQQWPRLRAMFAFRTARTKRRKSDLIQYDVQMNAAGDAERASGNALGWALAGAEDAATGRVTDLRRFLWRYGRDVSNARNAYRMLVDLFLVGRQRQAIPTEYALQVLRALPESNDGEILKRDILGIPAASPPLTPPISPMGLIEVLAGQTVLQNVPPEVVKRRIKEVEGKAISEVARFLDANYEALRQWKDELEAAIVANADPATLAQHIPHRFLLPVLRARPELIEHKTVALLSDEEFLELFDSSLATSAGDMLIAEAMRRDFGAVQNREMVSRAPARFFGAALNAGKRRELNPGWKDLWPNCAEAIFADGWPVLERSWSSVRLGIVILGYPRRSGPRARNWATMLATMHNDLEGDDRVRFQAYLLRTALDESSTGTWDLCALVLPELRPIILRGALPDDVYRMLSSDLPRFNTANFWDINRRILICLSYLRAVAPNFDAEASLGLSKQEKDVLVNGSAEEEDSKKSWFRWY